jgi:hypothetical protein
MPDSRDTYSLKLQIEGLQEEIKNLERLGRATDKLEDQVRDLTEEYKKQYDQLDNYTKKQIKNLDEIAKKEKELSEKIAKASGGGSFFQELLAKSSGYTNYNDMLEAQKRNIQTGSQIWADVIIKAGEKIGEAIKSAGKLMYDTFLDPFIRDLKSSLRDALTLESSMKLSAFDLSRGSIYIDRDAINSMIGYGFSSNAENYAFQRAMDVMGITSPDQLIGEEQREKFGQAFSSISERYSNLGGEDYFRMMDEFRFEMAMFREDFELSLIDFMIKNKDKIQKFLDTIMNFLDIMLDLISSPGFQKFFDLALSALSSIVDGLGMVLTFLFGEGDRSDSAILADTRNILEAVYGNSNYVNNNKSINVNNNVGITTTSDGRDIQREILNTTNQTVERFLRDY